MSALLISSKRENGLALLSSLDYRWRLPDGELRRAGGQYAEMLHTVEQDGFSVEPSFLARGVVTLGQSRIHRCFHMGPDTSTL